VPTWVAQSDLNGTPDPSTGHITTAGTSGQYLLPTGGAATWASLAANTLLVGNSSNEVTAIAAGTSGQTFVAKPAPGWIDDNWGLTVVIDGGGSTLTTGIKGMVRFPWQAGIEGWDMVVTTGTITSGSFGVDLYVEDRSSAAACSSNSKITAAAPPTISSGLETTLDSTLASWTTLVVAGDYLVFDIIDASSAITNITFSMWGKKLSTAG